MGENVFETDPVCGLRMNRNQAFAVIVYRDREYLICCPMCQSEFESDPERFALLATDDPKSTT